jgi:hypothetical protein
MVPNLKFPWRCSAERYGEELKVSAEENDDLKGTKTTVN